MSALTLPGTIPGLLRRGSPVVFGTHRGDVMSVETTDDGIEAGVVDENGAAWWFGPTGPVITDDLHLDLTDPTGRAHAAWWAFGRRGWRNVAMNLFTLIDARRGCDMPDADIARLRDLCLALAGVTP